MALSQVCNWNCMKNQFVFSLLLLALAIVVVGVQAETVEDWLAKGTKFDEQQRYTQAIDAYDHALELNSTNVNATYKKAIALYNANRYDESLIAFNTTTALDPENAKAWYYLGQIFESRGNDEDAMIANNKARMLGYVV